MCSNQEYRRRLIVFSHERLTRLHAEAGLLLDLKDSLGMRLALNVAGRTRVREVLRSAQRQRCFAVLCIGIPRLMAEAMAARHPEARDYFESLGPDVLPVIIVSAGGCSVAGIPRDHFSPGLN